MILTVTQNVNKINVTVTQSNTVIQLQPVLNNTGSGAGGGAVDSVNGQTGVVILTADNIDETVSRFWLTAILKSAYDSTVTWIATNGTNLINHLSNTSNPHNVTATQLGVPSGSGTSTGTNTGDNATNTQYSGLVTSKEDVSNKSNSDLDITSTSKFPTWNAIWTKALSYFQPLLVSGNNIKTINGTNILGNGNLVVGGSPVLSDTTMYSHTGTTAETLISTLPIPAGTITNNSIWEIEVVASRGLVDFEGSCTMANYIKTSAGEYPSTVASIGNTKQASMRSVKSILFKDGYAYYGYASSMISDYTTQGYIAKTIPFDISVSTSILTKIQLSDATKKSIYRLCVI